MAVVTCTPHSVRLVPPPGEWARIRRMAENAHPVFVARGWTYGWRAVRTPSVDELVTMIWHLYESVTRSNLPAARSRSGRWKVERLPDGSIGIELEMNE